MVELSQADIEAIAQREGWRVLSCDGQRPALRGHRDGLFNLIEFWVENHLLPSLAETEPPQPGITLWSVPTGQPLSQLHNVGPFQFSPRGDFLMIQGQIMRFWQPFSGQVQ